MIVEEDQTPLVSVGYEPRSLTALEQWRIVLCRFFPGSRRPVAKIVGWSLFLIFGLGFFAFLIAGWAGSSPPQVTFLVAVFAWIGLMFPVRWWRIKRQMIRTFQDLGPIEIDLNREGVSLRSKNRVTRIEWAGVRDLVLTRHELMLLYQAGDLSWIPLSAFRDLSHMGRFQDVVMSCLVGPVTSSRA